MKTTNKMSADAVVVGSGPGGATVARELARLGKDVILLERGADHQFYGNVLGTALILDRRGFTWSVEGNNMLRALTTGGSSMLYCGAAIDPPAWLAERYGIDLAPYVRQLKEEIGIRPTPEASMGPHVRRIRKAAHDLDIPWEAMDKFVNHDLCHRKCPVCMYGCKPGAKWTARDFAYEAVRNGARLINKARVEKVTVENGRATGVAARTPGGPLEVQARITVVAAGGLGTPALLLRSGVENAGEKFFADPLIITYGALPPGEPKTPMEPPMICGKLDNTEDGILIGDLSDSLPTFVLQMYFRGVRHIKHVLEFPRMIGVMCKVRDDMEGYVKADETFSKPYTREDQAKMARGVEISEKILRQAGCDPATIVSTPPRAAHPGGSAGIGKVVDTDLQTRVENLYVCDGSVLPEPCGLPPVLTLLGFGKRLVDTRLKHVV